MSNQGREMSFIDQCLLGLAEWLPKSDAATSSMVSDAPRAMPGDDLPEAKLDLRERNQAACLMRVNHVGEVCAQALYRGQALAARTESMRHFLQQTAAEEQRHLTWCHARLKALGGRTSLLNPVWWTGAFVMGAAAAAIGDDWSLGFVTETERQVEQHLTDHLARLPEKDLKSRAVLRQMRLEEQHHGVAAHERGAQALPQPVKQAMRAVSRMMTTLAYWV